MITQERLHELFDYDGKNLIRKTATTNCVKAGGLVGCINAGGYRSVRADNRRYYAHRLIWKMVHGEFPSGQIDHINGMRDDNRIENLRSVASIDNNRNRAKSNSASGVMGVYWVSGTNKWQTKIGVSYKKLYIGVFESLLDAACARKSAEIEHGFHENHGRTL